MVMMAGTAQVSERSDVKVSSKCYSAVLYRAGTTQMRMQGLEPESAEWKSVQC
jgi:hypothetical protein